MAIDFYLSPGARIAPQSHFWHHVVVAEILEEMMKIQLVDFILYKFYHKINVKQGWADSKQQNWSNLIM